MDIPVGKKDCQEMAISELEAIPTMTDREILESIAERLVVMELKREVEKKESC